MTMISDMLDGLCRYKVLCPPVRLDKNVTPPRKCERAVIDFEKGAEPVISAVEEMQ